MDQDQDLVVFTDDAGNEKTMEVLDYFFYEGQEYAVLTELLDEEEACDEEEEHDCAHCDHCGHDHGETDAYIMQVVPVGDDQEEFVPVEDALMDKLVEFVQNELYADEDEDLEDDAPEEEE